MTLCDTVEPEIEQHFGTFYSNFLAEVTLVMPYYHLLRSLEFLERTGRKCEDGNRIVESEQASRNKGLLDRKNRIMNLLPRIEQRSLGAKAPNTDTVYG